ncbi:MAG: AMP-binding protein [Methylococcaceae bacterium]
MDTPMNDKQPWYQYYPEGLTHNIDALQHKSLADFLRDKVNQFGTKPAFTHFGTTITYNELDRLSGYFAGFLQAQLGKQKQQRVVIMLPNLLQYPIVLFGILRAGFIAINTNPLYTSRELQYQIVDSQAAAIIILENFAHVLEPIIPETSLRRIIITGMGDVFSPLKSFACNFLVRYIKRSVPKFVIPSAISYTAAMQEGAKHRFNPPDIELSDLAFLQYTGGTTGISKGVMLTHKNLLSNVEQAKQWITHGNSAGKELQLGQEKVLTALPLYHIYALTANFLVFISLGAHNYLVTDPRNLKNLATLLSTQQINCFTGVNTLYAGLVVSKHLLNNDLSHLKLCLAGGMATRKTVADQWQQLTGSPLIEAYGLTEASPAVSINPMNSETFTGSAGLPLSSTSCEIRNPEGKELPIGEVGEIYVKGPQVMQGYWRHPEETAKQLTPDGWLKTGDIGRFDDKGLLYLVDRKKDMIIVSGFNVYPNEVEEVVSSHPDVLECGAIGVTDEKAGEAVKVFIVKKQPDLSEKSILDYCRLNLTGYKIPKYIEFKQSLPKSTVGKILRKDLKMGKFL